MEIYHCYAEWRREKKDWHREGKIERRGQENVETEEEENRNVDESELRERQRNLLLSNEMSITSIKGALHTSSSRPFTKISANLPY